MQQESGFATPFPNKPSKKLDLKLRRSTILIAAIVLAAGVCAAAPFYFSRYEDVPGGQRVRRLITTHDLWMHLHTIEQFDKALRSGVIYPRWVADINHGYGILTLIYYPPGFYYLTSAVNAVFNDWMTTLFVITAFALAGSGLALYLLARTFYGVLASGVAAVLYMLLPIHMLDLYWRGGLPSVIGYIFPPLVVYFGYKLGREGKPSHYAAFGFLYGTHLLTHFPVALMFSYALGFLALTWAVKERDWRIIARFACGMGLGLVLSAIYWFPAALEAKYAFEYTTDIFPYHQSYITLLPVADTAPYADFGRVLNALFAFQAVALIVTILVLRRLEQRNQPVEMKTREWSPISMWVTMCVATTLMCTSFSIYISKLLPKIQVAVPAWRWIAVSGMFTCLLVAAAIEKLRNEKALAPKLLWVCRVAVAAVILLNLWYSIQGSIIRPLSNPTYYPVATAWDVVESSWTPKAATHPQDLPDTPLAVTKPEGTAVEISRWEPQDREIQVNGDTPCVVRLKTYNFPGWTARIDGKVVPMLSDKDGVQQVEVPPGIHTVRASFENTGPRTTGTALSALGGLMIVGLAFAGRLRTRKAEDRSGHQRFTAEGMAGEGRTVSHSVSSARIPRISRLKSLAVIVLVIVVGTAIVVMTARRSNPSNSGRPGSAEAPASAPSDKPVGGGSQTVGSEAQLYLAGRDSVMVAADEKASDEMVSAISNRDQAALEALTESGRVLKVNNNTRVRVLQTMTGRTKIRILEGPHVMADGWVLERWLR